jgi:hypothetical protein
MSNTLKQTLKNAMTRFTKFIKQEEEERRPAATMVRYAGPDGRIVRVCVGGNEHRTRL